MEFNEKDIEFITTNIIVPCLAEYTKSMIDVNQNTYDMLTKVTDELINGMINKINRLELDNLKNMSFIKNVIFTNKLANEEYYKKYIAEWDRLNKDLIDEQLKNVTIPKDDKPIECDHSEKEYENYILTSYPPKYPWKCKKCGKTGYDEQSHCTGTIRKESIY